MLLPTPFTTRLTVGLQEPRMRPIRPRRALFSVAGGFIPPGHTARLDSQLLVLLHMDSLYLAGNYNSQ